MKPFTLADAETDLQEALLSGDERRIAAAGAALDQLDPALHPTAPVTLLAAALWYAEQGLPVFPLQPGSKIPFKGTRGCKDATTDPDQLRRWWAGAPDANIGIATGTHPTGGVDVVDIDGLSGQSSRAQHWPMFGQLQILGTVLTPRPGGMHLFVPPTDRGNKAGLLDGIDYRSTGGYVVAPPSRTEQGNYRWLAPLNLAAAAGAVAA